MIRVESDGPLTTLVLDRPEKRNALCAELVEALLLEMESAARSDTRLLVFRGAGKGFSAGFDLDGLEAQSDGDLLFRFVRLESLLQAIHHAPFATLALAHGACFGAAADLLCSCTTRIAAPDATFRMPGLRFELTLGTRRLAETVGAGNARALLETSATVGAEEARARGLVTHVAPEADWAGRVERACDAATSLSPDAARMLNAQTREHHRDADLAALVRSASRPGLKDRIAAFRDSVRAGR